MVLATVFDQGQALNDYHRRVQQTTRSRRGRKNDPRYRARRTLHTGADLLTDKQAARLTALFAIDEHVEVEATWGIYQRMIAAYRHPDPAAGRKLMVNLTNYIARSLLETGGFRPRLHPALVKSRSSWGPAKDTTETGNQ
ncbi:hypothetical protein GCM10010399_39990 [Dactylosporangium fulvum]